MGTDIHFIVQAKQEDVWETILPPTLDWHNEYDRKYKQWCSDRNYEAFAILANVRNRIDLIPIIPERRGLPDGITEDSEICWLGDHSHHWITLRELIDYPYWDKEAKSYGEIFSYSILFGRYYTHFLPELVNWANNNNIEFNNIRIVMGFDS